MENVLRITHWSTLLLTGAFLLVSPKVFLPVATALSFLHFSASLVLFYGHRGLRGQHRRIGIVFPLTALVILAAWGTARPGSLARWLVLYFALVFWHYCKQSYGFFVISLRKLPGMEDPKSIPRQITLASFLWLGVFGFLSSQARADSVLSFGYYIPSLGLPPEPLTTIGRIGAAAGLLACAWVCVRARKAEPMLTAISFYLWADLNLTHYQLLLALPALHAIQYLPIVFHRARERRTWRWAALWAGLGTLMFLLFRQEQWLAVWSLGLLGALEITMNVQHYFIDAYIWRARDPRLRDQLGIRDSGSA